MRHQGQFVLQAYQPAFTALVPKSGLEPERLTALPPQGSASTSSATWAGVLFQCFFVAGGGVAAGTSLWFCAGAAFVAAGGAAGTASPALAGVADGTSDPAAAAGGAFAGACCSVAPAITPRPPPAAWGARCPCR